MPDLPLTALDARQQKLVENARKALGKGDLDYAISACAQILKTTPACLPVRRLHRVAQLQLSSNRGGWVSKKISGLTALPFTFGSTRKDPTETLAQADKILNIDPHSVAGLELLAEAATSNDWEETVAFAYEAIRELDPTSRSNLLSLGEALLNANKPDAALKVVDDILRLNPVDGEAQNLMRRASIARTTAQGNWESGGDYREKISQEIGAATQGHASRHDIPDEKPHDVKAPDHMLSKADRLAAAKDQVERHPGDVDARYSLAELLFAEEQFEPAIAQYQQVLKNPRLRIQSLLGLARCFRARRLYDLAVAQLISAKKELGPLDDTKKEIVYELGLSFEQLNQPESAIAEFKEIYTEDIGFRDVASKINKHYAASDTQ